MIYLHNILRYIEDIPECTHMDISVFSGDVAHGNCNCTMLIGVPKYDAIDAFEMNIPIFSVHIRLRNGRDRSLTYLYADQKNVFFDGRNITKEIERIFDRND
jgi:hypothetical protein